MDFCILGLLILMPRNSYQLRKAFSRSLGLFYSASLGSIQVTVKKLCEKGFLVVKEEGLDARRAKVWGATDAGVAWFYDEFLRPIPDGRLEEGALARVYFLGLIGDRARRVRVLETIVQRIDEATSSLRSLQGTLGRQTEALALSPEERRAVSYQLATLDYGIGSHEHAQRWLAARLESERASTPDRGA